LIIVFVMDFINRFLPQCVPLKPVPLSHETRPRSHWTLA
jgi:hypothetical protein